MHPQPLVPEPPEDPVGPSGVASRAEPAEEPADQAGHPDPATWPALPEPVRDRIAELAAAAVAKLPATDVP
ncbi:RNA-binding protein, partial [Amycolatopsis mediterranei]